MKRPAFQFYPADWQKDPALQSCSIAARGLWIELMCIAHQAEPYGFVCVNGKAATASQIARLVGEQERIIAGLLGELEGAGVYSSDLEGRMFSRRMVKDERLRNVRAECGRLGGNPALVGSKDNHQDNLSSKQTPTPSSSSSSSSSKSKALSGKPDSKPLNGHVVEVEILAYLNEKAGRSYRPVKANISLIAARLKEGATPDEIRAVVDRKCAQWKGDAKMEEYLRPETLFGATKFASYQGELSGKAGSLPWDGAVNMP